MTFYVQAIRLSTKAAAIRAKQTIPDFLTLDKTFELHENNFDNRIVSFDIFL